MRMGRVGVRPLSGRVLLAGPLAPCGGSKPRSIELDGRHRESPDQSPFGCEDGAHISTLHKEDFYFVGNRKSQPSSRV
ncbi:unnamed protein product [Boreogadus saida]